MKETKTQKGITLIALIITIVVLLILAIVTIGTLDKTNIIGRANEAAVEYEKRKEEENTLIKEFEQLLEVSPSVKVYGTKEVYLIDSPEGMCLYSDGGVIMLKKIEREEALKIISNEVKEEIQKIESNHGVKFKYMLCTLDNYPAGGIFENDTIFFGDDMIIEFNENLTAELTKSAENIACYKEEFYGYESIIGIDHTNKQFISGIENQDGGFDLSAIKDYEERKTQQKITITTTTDERIELNENTPYLYCDDPESEDDIVYVELEDCVLYTTADLTGDTEAMKFTTADAKEVIKLVWYLK